MPGSCWIYNVTHKHHQQQKLVRLINKVMKFQETLEMTGFLCYLHSSFSPGGGGGAAMAFCLNFTHTEKSCMSECMLRKVSIVSLEFYAAYCCVFFLYRSCPVCLNRSLLLSSSSLSRSASILACFFCFLASLASFMLPPQ